MAALLNKAITSGGDLLDTIKLTVFLFQGYFDAGCGKDFHSAPSNWKSQIILFSLNAK